MSQLKRSRFFLIYFQDEPVAIDMGAFLRGRLELSHETQISAISPLTESAHLLTGRELEMLSRVPAHEWRAKSRLAADLQVPEEDLDALVRKGLLISDADDPESARLRHREDSFNDSQWHPYAALYNLMIKRPAGLDKEQCPAYDIEMASKDSQESADRFVTKHGMPPEPFHEVRGDGESVRLPLSEKQGSLYRALDKRKTVRAFDPSSPMSAEHLATLLHYVFGCHGYTKLTKGVPLLRKTSPSGGSLHPVEVYPLVLNVDGIATGLYHYRLRDHSLTRIRLVERWEAESLAVGIAAGQAFASSAHVLLLLTARFNRNFWKYRRNVKTHSVILEDIGHLSQTFYLVCSDLNLGSFLIASDAYFVEELLGLDGIEEGAIALLGCGTQLSGSDDYSLDFTPYVPGETEI